MTAATSQIKDIMIPLSLVVVSSLLQAVLPSSETLEKLLLSYLKNKWLLWELRASIVSLLVLLPYRAYLKHSEKKASTDIIKTYMETAHKIEDVAYKKDESALNENLASRNVWSTGIGIRQTIDIKLPHIKTFINNCLEYIESTQKNYSLDKSSVKLIFENYQITDITEITESVNKQNKTRGLNIKQDIIVQEIMPPIISEINNAYNIAILRIDAM